MNLKTTQTKIILFVSFYLTFFTNYTFFRKVFEVYTLTPKTFPFLVSIFIILFLFNNIILNIFRSKFTTKISLIIFLILSATAAYVMDSYGTIIDDTMLLNILNTDKHEAFDLLSWKLFIYLIFIGLLPSFLIYKTKLDLLSFKDELTSRAKILSLSIAVIFICLISFGKNYASFFREQRALRSYTNPTYYIFSAGKLASLYFSNSKVEFKQLGLNARIERLSKERKLIIFVVGETARRDRFSLNGYQKKTNPLLENERVYSFVNMTSCGTSTAISVPCVFSNFTRSRFSPEKAASTENLLDILTHTKNVNVLWRDNNSNSKGVANRVPFEDFKMPPANKICDPECRDVGMLIGLQEYVNSKSSGDVFIVLHQMGNHGPAYFKRYPAEFEKFKPVCKTNELSKCSNDEINNAYDNVILYTDFFLSKVIGFLKENSHNFSTTMFYVSDHGESLGENGVYLHGLPYFVAPDEQKNVPAILWLGDGNKNINTVLLKNKLQNPLSHDNVFHTFLGLLDVKTDLYEKELDILNDVRK